MVWSEVVGVHVAVESVVTEVCSETDVLPLVPLATYPAETVGVAVTVPCTFMALFNAPTMVPLPLADAGMVAEPAATDADAASA